MSHYDELQAWLKANRPEVFARIDGVSAISQLNILNEVTGIGVRVLDEMEDGSRRFLEAFKAQATTGAPRHG